MKCKKPDGEAAGPDGLDGRGVPGALLARPVVRIADRLRLLQPRQEQLPQGRALHVHHHR